MIFRLCVLRLWPEGDRRYLGGAHIGTSPEKNCGVGEKGNTVIYNFKGTVVITSRVWILTSEFFTSRLVSCIFIAENHVFMNKSLIYCIIT